MKLSYFKQLYKDFVVAEIKDTESIPDVQEWKCFLDSLPVPQDCFDTAYNKYLCRMHYFPFYKKVILNVISLGGLLLALPRIMVKRDAFPAVSSNDLLLERGLAVDYKDIFPDELYEEYDNILPIKQTSVTYGYLSREARDYFIRSVKKYPFHFYYNYYVLKELSKHSKYLIEYNVKATAVYVNERNIASPILTEIYENSGRKLISFMHGEYLLQLIMGYMKFSEFYVWSDSYVEMFTNDLNCEESQFKVYTPKKLTQKWDLNSIEPNYDITFYFSAESDSQVVFIAEIFKKLQQKGWKCKIRPHPRFSRMGVICSAFADMYIEDTTTVSLQDSLGNTKYAAGLASTVLSEALVEGRKIILDDMSEPQKFYNLKERKYSLLNDECLVLSEVVNTSDGVFL